MQGNGGIHSQTHPALSHNYRYCKKTVKNLVINMKML